MDKVRRENGLCIPYSPVARQEEMRALRGVYEDAYIGGMLWLRLTSSALFHGGLRPALRCVGTGPNSRTEQGRACCVLRVGAPQKPTEIPRPRLPTDPVGRSALSGLRRLFTIPKRQFQRAAGADFEGKPMKSAFFAPKNRLRRAVTSPHQWHASSNLAGHDAGKMGLRDMSGTTSASYVTANRYSRYIFGPS